MVNQELYQRLRSLLADFDQEFQEYLPEFEKHLGTGYRNFIVASILLLQASLYLKNLEGQDLQHPYKLEISDQEMTHLATLLLQRMLHVADGLKDKAFKDGILNSSLFRRLQKARKEQLETVDKLASLESVDA